MPAAETLQQRIGDRSAVVGVIGLGYVGLPLSLTFAEQGFTVLGFDVDNDKIEQLKRGQSYIGHLDESRIEAAIKQRQFTPTADFERLSEPDALLICVPTPLTPDREPDMQFIVGTAERIVTRLRPGQLVVLESTTYPGTTDELLRAKLEESGLILGRDFFLAFSPERENPGSTEFTTRTIPKVVGGVDQVSGDLAESLYDQVVVSTVRVSSARVAEATKLAENVFRAVNIAFVNELKVILREMDIDVWEVLDAASTKPFGFMRFDPGPGWGGHCIPIDPYYLAWKADQLGQRARFVELAGEVNRRMPEFVVERSAEALAAQGKQVEGSRVLIVGLAFKPNVADDRESPSYRLMEEFERQGAEVGYFDPHIPVIRAGRQHAKWAGMKSIELNQKTVERFDLAVIATDHDRVDYRALARWAPAIVDTRNAVPRDVELEDRVWPA
ncbi:MAG: nucleotide sugar dehydrogenase [Gemmatimonadetes bacterium]|nr:nucleotide sugar dehydrogenase [Gemmatimonadota bacterium]